MVFLAYLYWVGGMVVLMATGLLFFTYAGRSHRHGLARTASRGSRTGSRP